MRHCSRCDHEQTEWLKLVKVNDKLYCEMCLTLGLQCMDHHDSLKEKGFSITTKKTKKTLCKICKAHALEKMPLIEVKGHHYCPACISAGIQRLNKARTKVEAADDLKKRLN